MPVPTPSTDNDGDAAIKTNVEIRFDKLEAQILTDRADLNNEGANYMRSKYETTEIQKRLWNLTNQAKGLTKKVEKQQQQQERKNQEDQEEV